MPARSRFPEWHTLDRRQLVHAGLLAAAGTLTGRCFEASGSASPWTLLVRQQGAAVAVDPAAGQASPVDVPADTVRVDAVPECESLLITRASNVLMVRRGNDVSEDVCILPFASRVRPLVVANRVVGRHEPDRGLVIHDLETGAHERVPEGVLPGEPDDWHLYQHPCLPAAVIDARGVAGKIIVLPAGSSRESRVIDEPTATSVGIAPDGNGVMRVASTPTGWTLAPSVPTGTDPRPPLSAIPISGEGTAEIGGPLGRSDSVLLDVNDHEILLVTVDGDIVNVADEAVIVAPEQCGAGELDFWQASPDGTALIMRSTNEGGAGAAWSFWEVGNEPVVYSELPVDLETVAMSGSASRWFHGASIDAEHLGAGEFRLMAMDVTSGVVALDQVLDRRLELAATTISHDGAVVAHVQAGNTQVDVWAADLRHGRAPVESSVEIDPAPVAASAIDLRVATDDDGMVIASGLDWSATDHPEPMVIALSANAYGDTPVVTTCTGELIGLVPASLAFPGHKKPG